jgi:hypothetical protein
LVDLSHGVTDELDSPCEGVPGVLGKRPGSSGRGTRIVLFLEVLRFIQDLIVVGGGVAFWELVRGLCSGD